MFHFRTSIYFYNNRNEVLLMRKIYSNYYKGHMDKIKGEGGGGGGRWVRLGWGGGIGRKVIQL